MCTVQFVMNIMRVQVTLMNSVARMTINMLQLHWLIKLPIRWHCTITATKSEGIIELVWPNRYPKSKNISKKIP